MGFTERRDDCAKKKKRKDRNHIRSCWGCVQNVTLRHASHWLASTEIGEVQSVSTLMLPTDRCLVGVLWICSWPFLSRGLSRNNERWRRHLQWDRCTQRFVWIANKGRKLPTSVSRVIGINIESLDKQSKGKWISVVHFGCLTLDFATFIEDSVHWYQGKLFSVASYC